MKKGFFIILAAMLLMPANSRAETEFSVGADLVSSYVWRGTVGAGASFQPSLGLTAGGFNIGFWGSTDIATLGLKEVDLALGYTVGGFSIGLTDYWWNGEGAYDYFQLFKKDANSHLLELNLGYGFDFGLNLSLNTFLAGAQDKYADGTSLKRSYTTYFEAGYDFSIGNVNLTAALGFSPWNKTGLYTGWETEILDPLTGDIIGSEQSGTKGFAVNNISLTARKDIVITEKFSLPVYGQIGFNPAKEDAFIVFGISF